MRAYFALVLALLVPIAAKAQNVTHMEVCDSQQKAQQYAGSQGKFSPDGCRTFTVTRVESAEGAMRVLDLNPGTQGVVNSIVNATMPTQWWTSCANIHAP